jgi:uncharacterized phage infection (PIP) family protein YhgE
MSFLLPTLHFRELIASKYGALLVYDLPVDTTFYNAFYDRLPLTDQKSFQHFYKFSLFKAFGSGGYDENVSTNELLRAIALQYYFTK